jgi:RNA polymerase sigma-70 factor (ECF subfamily)
MTVDEMPVELDNEIALVRLAQSGSTESFEILVNRYEQGIYRLGHIITKNKQDAEDVLQETFLKAYANIHQFGGESRFFTWLAGIAMNETMSRLQLRQLQTWDSSCETAATGEVMSTPGDLKGWYQNPDKSYSKPQLSAILSKSLEDIDTPLRAVFALHDIEGFSDEETASMLGLPLEAVTARLTHARLKLRRNLSVWFENPSVAATGQSGCESVCYSLGAALSVDRECT